MNTHDQQYSNTPNVFNIFSGRRIDEPSDAIIRIAPENDGLEILYSNDTTPNKLYSLKIVCWAMRESGEIVALVPWLNSIVSATDLNDPLNGRWEGYRDPNSDDIFYVAPAHKVMELETSERYYHDYTDDRGMIQELPDTIGTHAVLTNDEFKGFHLVEVLSWRLMSDGSVHGMLVNEDSVSSTPVLPGDTCLYSAQDEDGFRYFFQHKIANKIKEQDPEALAAVSLLIDQ